MPTARRFRCLFAARDEEEKLPQALETLRQIDYPALEIVAVNDRSTDSTAQILSDAASARPAFESGEHFGIAAKAGSASRTLCNARYEASSGEWLLFTDADVRFRAGRDSPRKRCSGPMQSSWTT